MASAPRPAGRLRLPDYLRLVRQWDGYVVVDDTQALGILGEAPARDAPYGRGGAGTPAWYGVQGPGLIVGSSLAKGFGAPLAVIAGDARLIARFEDLSATSVHSSPPLSGGNQRCRARTRPQCEERQPPGAPRLVKIVRRFRENLRQIGLSALGGLFPVQTLRAIPGIDPRRLYGQLLDCGVKAVLRSGEGHIRRRPYLPDYRIAHPVRHRPLHGRIAARVGPRAPSARKTKPRASERAF